MSQSLTAADIGGFFIRKDYPKEIWEMISFCELPTVVWKNVATGQKFGGAVGSRNAQEFVRLIPES